MTSSEVDDYSEISTQPNDQGSQDFRDFEQLIEQEFQEDSSTGTNNDEELSRRGRTILLRPSVLDLSYKPSERLFRDGLDEGTESEALARYQENKHFSRLIGDVPFEYNWVFGKSVYKIDGTYQGPSILNTEQIESRVLQDNEEYIPLEDCNKIIIPLTPDTTHREIGKVFFEKEIRYIPNTQPRVPSLKIRPVKHIVYRGDPEDNDWYLVDRKSYQRTKRDSKYLPGHGILKLLTQGGQRDEYWQTRIRYVLDSIQNPEYQGHHSEILNIIFTELMENQYNLEHWFNTSVKLLSSNKNIQKEESRQYKYHVNRKFRHQTIRKSDRHFRKATAAQRKIDKAWRAHVLRSFGTSRTFFSQE